MKIEVIKIGGPDLRPVEEFSGLMESVVTEGLARIDAMPDEVVARIFDDRYHGQA